MAINVDVIIIIIITFIISSSYVQGKKKKKTAFWFSILNFFFLSEFCLKDSFPLSSGSALSSFFMQRLLSTCLSFNLLYNQPVGTGVGKSTVTCFSSWKGTSSTVSLQMTRILDGAQKVPRLVLKEKVQTYRI